MLSYSDIQNFLRKERTSFLLDDVEGDLIRLSSREGGSVGYGRAGKETVKQGKDLVQKLRRAFSDYKWELDVVDEWVLIEGRYSPKGSIAHLSDRELFKVFKSKYRDAKRLNSYGLLVSLRGVEFRFSKSTYGGITWQVEAGYSAASVATEDDLFDFISKVLKKTGSSLITSTLDGEIARKVAQAYMVKTGRVKTAGEIRFIKDTGPEGRVLPENYKFLGSAKKPLAKVLWSISCALGHLVSSYSTFTKIKAVSISPDGKLGGRGYIQEIKDMRKNLNSSIEALSAMQDTINDELRAPHWEAGSVGVAEQDEKEVEEMLSDSQEINEDPESFVEEEYEQQVIEDV